MLASQRNGTLYVGVTDDLHRRIEQHRSGTVPGFTRKYRVYTLVWFEIFERIDEAIMERSSSRDGIAPGNSSSSRMQILNGSIWNIAYRTNEAAAPGSPSLASLAGDDNSHKPRLPFPVAPRRLPC
ncbi:GIY-YIG nuclease family protein [Labrys neptuniae]